MENRASSLVLLGGVALAAALVAARPAAAKEKIAVFPLEEVKLEAKDRAAAGRFAELMRRSALKAGHDLTVPPMGLFDVLVALDCPDVVPECLVEVGKHFKVPLVAYGSVTRKKGAFQVKLNLFDAATMRMRGAIEAEVRGRSLKDLAHSFDLLAERLFRGTEAAPPGGNLVISTTPAEATVELNGVIKGLTPLRLDGLAPGDYSIELTRPGFVRSVARARVTSGETTRIEAAMKPTGELPTPDEGATAKPPPAPPPSDLPPLVDIAPAAGAGSAEPAAPAEPSKPRRHLRAVTWAFAGVGVALFGAAGGVGFLTKRTQSEFDEHPVETLDDMREMEDLAERGRTYALATDILIGAGATAIAGAVVLLVLDLTRKAPETERAARLRLSPAILPAGAGLSAEVSWP